MEIIAINKLHSAAVECLESVSIDYNTKLKTIGHWYYLYLKNNEVKSTYLNIPYFSEDFKKLVFEYLRYLGLLHNLITNTSSIKNYNDTCLFDIFNVKIKNKHQKIEELIIPFNKKIKDKLIWGINSDIITSQNSFLPVFDINNIVDFDKNSLHNTFKLFKIIKKNNLIIRPVIIDFEDVFISFNNINFTFNKCINETIYKIDKNINRKEAKKDYILHKDHKYKLEVKYPYSYKPTNPLNRIGKNKFYLILNNRFAYNQIEDNEIYLTNKELTNKPVDFFVPNIEVVDTQHSKNLYYSLIQFQEKWANLELNKFKYPYPKYWFLFINNSKNSEIWIQLFVAAYPFIESNPLFHLLKSIIEELVQINWSDKIKGNLIHLYFPLLTNKKEREYSKLLNNFNDNLGRNCNLNHDISQEEGVAKYFLDSFNTIDIVNKMNTQKFKEYKIIIPDFLLINFPFLRYSLFKYAYETLNSTSRIDLDIDNSQNTIGLCDDFKSHRKLFIKEGRKIKKEYERKFNPEEVKEIENTEEEIESHINNTKDFDFTNDEEKRIEDNIYNQKDDLNKSSIINYRVISNNEELDLNEDDKILILKNTLIDSTVKTLKRGDLFIHIDSLKKSIAKNENKTFKLDKLTNIDKSVENYKTKLKVISNIYRRLQIKGLSFSEYQFKKDYLTLEDFTLPRSFSDWKIICNELNIDNLIVEQSFVLWKGRKNRNDFEKLYISVINFLIEEDYLGTIDSDYCSIRIEEEISKNHLENYSKLNIDGFTTTNYAKMILNNIKNHLVFEEVKSIKRS